MIRSSLITAGTAFDHQKEEKRCLTDGARYRSLVRDDF